MKYLKGFVLLKNNAILQIKIIVFRLLQMSIFFSTYSYAYTLEFYIPWSGQKWRNLTFVRAASCQCASNTGEEQGTITNKSIFFYTIRLDS